MNNKNKSLVLLSGGMDSLLCLEVALKDNHKDEIYLLHFNYGQLTFIKEQDSFNKISEYYKIPKENTKLLDITFLKKFGGSALLDEAIQLSSTGENLDKSIVPSSYVPFRNTIMISIALSYAEIKKISNIFIGAVQDDELGYPDCRKVYFDAFQKLADLGGNDSHVKIKTPLIHLTKVEILTKLINLKSPLHLTWSCYKNIEKACGQCDSCRLRLNAFEKIGVADSIPYI